MRTRWPDGGAKEKVRRVTERVGVHPLGTVNIPGDCNEALLMSNCLQSYETKMDKVRIQFNQSAEHKLAVRAWKLIIPRTIRVASC